ncbi:unnamed protein product, partial [marine sediment metagenome]
DLNMPKKNGVDVIREIKEINSDVPIILITGYEATDTYKKLAVDVQKLIKPEDIIAKPVEIPKLSEVLSRYFPPLKEDQL